jgi:type I restriction enzyme S subunit
MQSERSPLKLGDLVSLVRGNTYKSALLGSPGPVLLGLASIQRDGGFRGDSLKSYGGDSAQKMLLRPGDLYVSLKDVTQSGDLLGAVARVPMSVELGRLTQDTVKLQFDRSRYPPDLLYWTLRSPEYRAYCRERAIGTTNLSLSRDDFLAFTLPTADRVILDLVELLEAVEQRIELLRQTSATLEAIAKMVFRNWFIDFAPVRAKAAGCEPEGMDAGTASMFPEGFEESSMGPLPSGWRSGTLGDVCSNPRRQAKPGDMPPDTPYIGLEHMPRKSIALESCGTAAGLESGKFWFERDDVLFGKLRPY